MFTVAEESRDAMEKSMLEGKMLEKELNCTTDEKENASEREAEPFNLSDCETDPDESAEGKSKPKVL